LKKQKMLYTFCIVSQSNEINTYIIIYIAQNKKPK